MGILRNPGRRRFLIVSALVGGGLLVGYALRGRDRLAKVPAFTPDDRYFALNGWVKIGTDGKVVVAVPRQEMGQGVYTSLPMLVAEELDADWGLVRAEQSPVEKIYGNLTILADGLPVDPNDTGTVAEVVRWVGFKLGEGLGMLVTGGSTSVRDAWEPMRLAGASGREMLVAAAAQRWGVAASECTTKAGYVLHNETGRRFGYGELVVQASQMEAPREPRLKDHEEYRIIGKPVPRLDVPAKVTGAAEFGIDVRLPGMLYAAVAQCPVFGGVVDHFDAGAISGLAGVKTVVPVPDGVAVVADSYWRALSALKKLPVVWNEGRHAALDSAAVYAQYRRDMAQGEAREYESLGDAEAALAKAARIVEAEYQVPFLAHACMEPMNCTARVEGGRCEVWAPNQSPSLVRMVAASVLGVDGDRVTVHTPFLGGGFGRRAEMDFVTQAVTVAKALDGTPVKLLWSREEDIQHDAYRPAVLSRLRAGLDASGRPVALWNRIVGPSVTQSYMGRLPWLAIDMPDKTNAEGAAGMPYGLPHRRIEHVLSATRVPVGFWRSVGHSYNAFFVECFIDELAAAAGRDPYRFRRAMLAERPRHLKVLDAAAAKAGWWMRPSPGVGRGIALHESFRSIVAQVAEVSVSSSGAIEVHRVVCAIDCGTAVNPDTVVAQMQSGIIFGLTAALYGEITLKQGRVEQSNFPSYPMLRMAQTPVIETYLVDSGAALGGVGEPGTPPIAPAVANALFAATGQRVRKLPILPADRRGV